MAIGKKTGGSDFKPGNNANPNGRPLVPEDLKDLRRLNQAEFIAVVNKFLFMTKDELLVYIKGPIPTLELMVGSVISKAVTTGDYMRLNAILDRLIGKVPSSINLNGSLSGIEIYLNMPPDERVRRIEEIRHRMETK